MSELTINEPQAGAGINPGAGHKCDCANCSKLSTCNKAPAVNQRQLVVNPTQPRGENVMSSRNRVDESQFAPFGREPTEYLDSDGDVQGVVNVEFITVRDTSGKTRSINPHLVSQVRRTAEGYEITVGTDRFTVPDREVERHPSLIEGEGANRVVSQPASNERPDLAPFGLPHEYLEN